MTEPSCDEGWVLFPVPLAEDRVARLHLPVDLTEAEAKKIQNVVMALSGSEQAFDEKIERDAEAGKLDGIENAAREDLKAGRVKEL